MRWRTLPPSGLVTSALLSCDSYERHPHTMRHCSRSSEGKESQKWLKQRIQSIIDTNPKLGVTVKEFPHPWGQNSLIVHFPRATSAQKKHDDDDDDIVVVGAHQDSTNLLPFLGAPGADDVSGSYRSHQCIH